MTIGEGEIHRGSFIIKSTNDINVRGLIYASSRRIKIDKTGFDGLENKITYTFDGTGLSPGDIEMGTFTDGKLKESEFTYDDYYLAKPFETLIMEKKVPMSVLDEKAGRVLRLIFRSAMNPQKVVGNQCSEAHYDACRQIGEEGIVLLKNDHFLPLEVTSHMKLLVVGENGTRSLTQGGGSSELKTLTSM